MSTPDWRPTILILPGDCAVGVLYARRALEDSLQRGEAPFAARLLYGQAVDHADPLAAQGCADAGAAWLEVTDAVVAYVDVGVTDEMRCAMRRAEAAGHHVELRRLPGWSDWPDRDEPRTRHSWPADAVAVRKPRLKTKQ